MKYSGQNLAYMATTNTYTTENVISGSLAMWFNEYRDANMNDINKVGTSSSGKYMAKFLLRFQAIRSIFTISGSLDILLRWLPTERHKLAAQFRPIVIWAARLGLPHIYWRVITLPRTLSDVLFTKRVRQLNHVPKVPTRRTEDCAKPQNQSMQTHYAEHRFKLRNIEQTMLFTQIRWIKFNIKAATQLCISKNKEHAFLSLHSFDMFLNNS